MISVSEKAKEVLRDILLDKVDNTYACLRLTSPEEGKLGLGIDVELPGDKVIEYQGRKLLLVENSLAESLEGMMLAIDDDEGSLMIVVTEPQ